MRDKYVLAVLIKWNIKGSMEKRRGRYEMEKVKWQATSG